MLFGPKKRAWSGGISERKLRPGSEVKARDAQAVEIGAAIGSERRLSTMAATTKFLARTDKKGGGKDKACVARRRELWPQPNPTPCSNAAASPVSLIQPLNQSEGENRPGARELAGKRGYLGKTRQSCG
jgi:hypothetical protein